MAPKTPDDDTMIIDGFKTTRVDTTNLAFQADSDFLPDKAGLWVHPEEHDGWVHAHNAIRFEVGELKRVVTALATTTLVDWQVASIKAWWAGHEKHVHEHHENEDDVMNPVLRTRINYPDKLEADHAELVATMDELSEHVSMLEAGDSLEGLRSLWLRYESLMLPHLFEEEQVGLPLARAYFTPTEIEKVVSAFLKKGDPVSLGAFVHVMGHKADAKRFMQQNGIPGFVWHLPGKGFKALRSLYREKMQTHIDSLLAGEPVVSRTKKQLKENAVKASRFLRDEGASLQCALSPSKRVNVMSAVRSFDNGPQKQASAAPLAAALATVPSKPAQRFSSSVIREVNDWCDSSLLMPHEPIRVMLNAFERGFHLDTLDKVGAFEQLWRVWVFDFIHHHHDIEETIYMPWINERVASPAGLAIETDHESLIKEMEAISAVAAEKTLAAGARLPAMLHNFAAGMKAHLANEETYVPQMLRESGYAHEDEGALIGKVMASLSPDAMAMMMPLVLHALELANGYGPLTADGFAATLPQPLQEALPAWKATFKTDFLDVIEKLCTPA